MNLNVIEKVILDNLNKSYENILIIAPYNTKISKYIKFKYKKSHITFLYFSDEKEIVNNNDCDLFIEFEKNKLLSFENNFDCIICLGLEQYSVKPQYFLASIFNYFKSGSDIFISFYNSLYLEYFALLSEPNIYSSDLLFNKFPFYPLNIEIALMILDYISASQVEIYGLLDQKFYESENTISLNSIAVTSTKDKTDNFIAYYLIKAQLNNNFITNNKKDIKLINLSFEDMRRLHMSDSQKYWKSQSQYLFPLYKSFKDPVEVAEAKYVAKILTSTGYKSILEVGCGYGRIIKEIFQINDFYRIQGVDISPVQINNAKSYLNGLDVIISEFDGKYLPYKDNSFDIVFTCGTLSLLEPEHACNLIKEIYRVAKHLIIHIEDYKVINYRLFNHPYEIIYKRHGIPLVFNERQEFKTKNTYIFKKLYRTGMTVNLDNETQFRGITNNKNTIRWDFEYIMKYDFYFIASNIEQILNYRNLMRYLPYSKILIDSTINENKQKELRLFMEKIKVSFTDILPKQYNYDKVILVNTNPEFQINIKNREHYFIVFLANKLDSLNISEFYDFIILPGDDSLEKININTKTKVLGISYTDSAYMRSYPKSESIEQLKINNPENKEIIFYRAFSEDIYEFEKYINTLSDKYIILIKSEKHYTFDNINYIYDFNNISDEILLSISDIIISDDFTTVISALTLNKKAIFKSLNKNSDFAQVIISNYSMLNGKLDTIRPLEVDLKKYIAFQDGSSSYRIINSIISNMNN